MPKMKTNRGAKKRFKITATGKVRRPKGGRSAQHDRQVPQAPPSPARQDMVSPAMERRVKILLPYG